MLILPAFIGCILFFFSLYNGDTYYLVSCGEGNFGESAGSAGGGGGGSSGGGGGGEGPNKG